MIDRQLELGSPLPAWLPDESLYSLAARFHKLSGNPIPARTTKALFGHPQQGSQHDFPCRLDAFCANTFGMLGEARTIALDRTIVPFYFPLRDGTEVEGTIECLRRTADRHLKFRLGLLTSRYRANHPLKACPSCLHADEGRHGIAYWHLSHQYPGVWMCPTHEVPLLVSALKSTGVERFGWLLPRQAQLGPATSSPLSSDALSGFAQLARLSIAWAQLPEGTHFDTATLGAAYRLALVERGHLAKPNRLNLPVIAAAFVEAIAPLRQVPELAGLPSTHNQGALHLGKWLRKPRGGTHPLSHLAIIHWLFDDFASFLATYHRAADALNQTSIAAAERPTRSDPRREQVAALAASGMSSTAIARRLGVEVVTAMAWMTQAGLTSKTRPKLISGEVRTRMIRALKTGVDKETIAQDCGVSVVSVTRIMRTEVGLAEAWREVRHRLAQRQAQTEWRRACRTYGPMGTNVVRAHASAAYAWLYRNDRAWLVETSRNNGNVRVAVTSRQVDWDARDASLANDVRRIAADLAARSGSDRINLWQIYQVLPELKAKLSSLHRLPLTQKAIAETTHRRRPTPKGQKRIE